MPKKVKRKKGMVIWIAITGGVYDCIHHVKPSEGYIAGCKARGCDVVKFVECLTD